MRVNKIQGCVYAMALGDALGAAYEGGSLEKAAWKVMGKRDGKYRWTDDTQMAIDIMASLVAFNDVNQDDLARRFAASYNWTRGYGAYSAKVLKKIRAGIPWREANRLGSNGGPPGNGAAVRSVPVGLFYAGADTEVLMEAATRTALVTHTHPLSIAGAKTVALATAYAFDNVPPVEILKALFEIIAAPEFAERFDTALNWLAKDTVQSAYAVRRHLGNGVFAHESVVTAVYAALSYSNASFETLLDYVRQIGGDVDTIGAMAGAIWGAANGEPRIPHGLLLQLDDFDLLNYIQSRFADIICGNHQDPQRNGNSPAPMRAL